MPRSRASGTAPARTATGGGRRHLTLQQKVLIIDKREREGLKQDALAQWAAAEFALPSVPTQPTISNILKDKDRLREALRLHPNRGIKSVREVTCPQFEDCVVEWILARTTTTGPNADPRPVDRRAVLEFATGARHQFPNAKDLGLSEGWLSRLLKRREISLRPGANNAVGEGKQDEEDQEPNALPTATLAPGQQARPTTNGFEAPSPARSTAREVLQPTPQRAPRTNESFASPGWSDIASPVFASTPIQRRASRTTTTTTSSSGSQSPVGLRSLARAASPFAAHTTPTTSSRVDVSQVHQQVSEYYGTHLKTTRDLRTNASPSTHDRTEWVPARVRRILEGIPQAITTTSFGCGFPIPLGIQGLHALDLGCGSGRDAYVLAALIGASGSVTGIDMTPSLLEIAQHNLSVFTQRLSTPIASLHFVQGYMESLDRAGIETESMDLAIANFALSLTPDKALTMREIFRVLRNGGEFQFSDIYASRRVPGHVRDNTELFCEGLGGAMYVDDFRVLCREVGFGEPRPVRVERAPLKITDETLAASVGSLQYQAVTFRCFKVSNMELQATEQDYGHVAKYLGTIPGHEGAYELDLDHRFETRRPVRVGGNTAAILTGSWLARHFTVDGDYREHFGRFTQSSLGPTAGGAGPSVRSCSSFSSSTSI